MPHSSLSRRGFVRLAGLAAIGTAAAACGSKPAPTTAPAQAADATAAPVQATQGATPAQEAASATTASSSAAAQDLLTVADLERVTGLSGVKIIPRNPEIGAGGDLNFVNNDEQLILMLKLSSASGFETMKSDSRYSHGPIGDIGDDAFGIPSPLNREESFGIAFRKGLQAATISTYFVAASGDLAVSMDEQTELAQLVASRLP